MVRFLTAGESHGRALVVILEGIPAGLRIDLDSVTRDLRRRQGGYGRGRRMAIESDRADIISGVRAGETIGGPIAMLIENRDWVNWQQTMFTGPAAGAGCRRERSARRSRSRGPAMPISPASRSTAATDIRDILERASARETAARVAAGAIARQLLRQAGVRITSHVFSIGGVALPDRITVSFDAGGGAARRFTAPLRGRGDRPRG